MEEIKKRVETGYTLSVYGTREAVHEQMLKDINTLLKMHHAKMANEELEIKIENLYRG